MKSSWCTQSFAERIGAARRAGGQLAAHERDWFGRSGELDLRGATLVASLDCG